MASVFKLIVTLLIFITTVHDVFVLPVERNLKSETTQSSLLKGEQNSSVIVVRVKKASVRVGKCSHGKEYYKRKCRTLEEIKRLQDNDYDDNVTEVDVVEVTPMIQTETVGEYDISSSIETETSTVTLTDVTGSRLDSTEGTLDTINAMENSTIPPALVLEDENNVDTERLKTITYTLLVFCVLLFTWLFKLLYDYCVRRDNDTDAMLCSSTSSHCRLCSR